jgi:hypothetical protein
VHLFGLWRSALRKSFRFLIFGGLAIAGLMAGHLVYLYNHREFGPSDFIHPFILKLEYPARDEMKKKQVSEILQQKFTYLGTGTQVTAFESADHRYVIKFFNLRNTIKEEWFHKKSRLRKMCSFKWIVNAYFKKEERLLKSFKCHRLAFQDLREESGLIYLHLDRSSSLAQKVELLHRDGKSYQVDLDSCPFILQKKVVIALTHLEGQMALGNVEEAREGVRQIYQLFLSRAQKGYTDRRQNLLKNYGFADGRAIQLDVGRIRLDKRVKQNPVKDLARIVGNLSASLPPDLVSVLQECLEESQKNIKVKAA